MATTSAEARAILEQLGEPVRATIISHEVLQMSNKKPVGWYTMECQWSKADIRTKKKQRFSVIQDALLHVKEVRDHLRINTTLPPLPVSFVPGGTLEAIRVQRTKEYNAFLDVVLAIPQLRRVPALLQLLAPDEITSAPGPSGHDARRHSIAESDAGGTTGPLVTPRSAPGGPPGSTSDARAAAQHTPRPSGAMSAVSLAAAPADRAASSAVGGEMESEVDGGEEGASGFAVPAVPARYPHRTEKTAAVVPAATVTKVNALLERCVTAVNRLQAELAECHKTIRTKDTTIEQLQREVEQLRASMQG